MANLTPFGKTVRKYRIDRGETQLDVADALGVSVAYWSAIETGKKNINKKIIEDLAAHFQLNDLEVASLRRDAELSQTDYKINMIGLNDTSRKLVVGFARRIENIDHEKQKKILELLDVGD